MSDEKNINDNLNDDANQFADHRQDPAPQFTENAKPILYDGKNVAIIAHITLIGWIIALFMNNNTKNEFASFYIRQMLGLMIVAFILSFIPFVGWILNIIMLVLWIISLLGAFEGQKKLVPVLGEYFQDWFKSL
ncbi:DUF4870 domain-containing protein [Mariniflexile sp.]|uniref:DUF4870 domain-containing protein n=1 Tax=Mariniflexile sp. TaxID=1979402 RepID=UPI004047B6EF